MLSKSKKQTRMEEAYRFKRSAPSNCNTDNYQKKIHQDVDMENKSSFLRIHNLFFFMMEVKPFTVPDSLGINQQINTVSAYYVLIHTRAVLVHLSVSTTIITEGRPPPRKK